MIVFVFWTSTCLKNNISKNEFSFFILFFILFRASEYNTIQKTKYKTKNKIQNKKQNTIQKTKYKTIQNTKTEYKKSKYYAMLSFQLPANQKLPPLDRWLNPKYLGGGDLIVSRFVGGGRHDPQNWKSDFPEYAYDYPKLLTIKNAINTAKSGFDDILKTPEDEKRFFMISSKVRLHDTLRGRNGLVASTMNAEVVTNAWLKMYEMMPFVDPILDNIQKKRNKVFQSMSFAEAPGNFMLAINHYMESNYPSIEWRWAANSYRHRLQSTKYLEDSYGLMRKYPQKWWFGSDGDGDITSPDNIRTFTAQAKTMGLFHLVTSDVKYVPEEENYDEEETINIPVHLGHILCCLTTLKKGGTVILKHLNLCESQTVSLLWILAGCFNNLQITKPETSKPANSETYIIATGYKKNLTRTEIDRLLQIMQYIRYMNTESGSPCIFHKEDIPEAFVNAIHDAMNRLSEHQIQFLQRDISMFSKYKNSSLRKINEDFAEIRQKHAQQWMQKQKIKPLPGNKTMIV